MMTELSSPFSMTAVGSSRSGMSFHAKVDRDSLSGVRKSLENRGLRGCWSVEKPTIGTFRETRQLWESNQWLLAGSVLNAVETQCSFSPQWGLAGDAAPLEIANYSIKLWTTLGTHAVQVSVRSKLGAAVIEPSESSMRKYIERPRFRAIQKFPYPEKFRSYMIPRTRTLLGNLSSDFDRWAANRRIQFVACSVSVTRYSDFWNVGRNSRRKIRESTSEYRF